MSTYPRPTMPTDPDTAPGALGTTLRHARALGWTVADPAPSPHMTGLTAPNGANRVAFIADPITGAILRTWVDGRHTLPRPWLPVHAMAQVTQPGTPVALTKAYVPASTYRER